MPVSIKSLLTTHPFKLKPSLEHICSKLKLPTDGTVPLLRKRILTHVKENQGSEEKVRKISIDYKIKHPKTPINRRSRPAPMSKPLSPLVHVANQTQQSSKTPTSTAPKQIFSQPFSQPFNQSLTQPDLFDDSQKSNRRLSIAEVTKKIDEFSEILQLEGIADKIINDEEPEFDDSDYEDDDVDDNESDVDDDVFHATENARRYNIQPPFTHLEQSYWCENEVQENAFALMDKRIQSLQEHFDNSISSLTQKHEGEMKKIRQKLNQVNDGMKNLKDEYQDKEKHFRKQISELSEKVKALQDKQPCLLPNRAISTAPLEIESVSSSVIEISEIEAISPQTTSENEETDIRAIPTQITPENEDPPHPSNDVLPENTPTNHESNSLKAQAPNTKTDIIIITDSNGKYLDPKLLHEHKNVIIEKRFFLNKAKNEIPVHNNPQNVSDVVMLTGINDLKYEDIPVVLNKLDQTCQRYQSAFPKAKIHIGSVAPANPKCKQYNFHLENLAEERQVPFIPNDELINAGSGIPITGMLEPNDIHYTKKGLRTYAKHIKRSLYGYKRRVSRSGPNPFPRNPAMNQNYAQGDMHPGQVHALKNLFSMALSFLPNQLY